MYLQLPSTVHSKASLKRGRERDLGDMLLLPAVVSLLDGSQRGRKVILRLHHGSGNGNDFLLPILGVFEESGAPRIASHRLSGNEHGSRCKLAGHELDQLDTERGFIQNIVGQVGDFLVGVSSIQVTEEELVGCRNAYLVVQRLQDLLLHAVDLFVSVSFVA